MFPFGRLGQDKTTTTTSRPVAPPLGRWVESESPELVLMEEESSSSRKKRRQQSVFLGVFPPKLGHCSCGKRSRTINTKRVKRVIVDESTAEEDSEEADEEDELVVVPFTTAAAAGAVGVGSDEGGSATEEDQQDEDYSPPKPSRMIYAVRDSQPVDLNPSPLERSPSLVASTSSSDDDDDEASLIQRALTIATETMSEPDSQPRPLQATCHHDKTKSDRPKMLCTTDSCNTQWCKRCIEKHYTDTPFLLGGRFLCPLCRDVCSCAACRRKRANGGVRPSMAPRTRVVGVKVLPSRKGKEKEVVQVVEKRRRASTVWDASDEEEYGEEGSEEEDEEEEEEKSEEEYRAAGGSAERNRIRRKRLGGSKRRRSRRVSTGGEKGESTSASTSRRLPTRTTRRAIQVEKESLEMSISTSLQDGGEGALFPWLSKESWKAGLEGSDAELELEESSEEEEEMDVEVEEQPVKSMWSSAGGLFGDVGVGAGGGGAEPTLAFVSTTTQEEDAAIILSPPIDSHHTSTDLDHVLASLTSPPSMTLDPTPQPAILAPVARAPPLGSGQHSRNKVVWREGPARRKRRLEGSLGGGVGGDSQSPMSDPQSPEVETGSHPPGIARRTSNGSNGSLGAPPPYSSRDELQAPKPQPIATSSSSAPSTSFQPHARSATAPPVVDADLAPAFVWSPPQPQPPPQAQHYYPSQHQQQFPQYPTFPQVPPPRPASSLSNYDPRTPISGVRRTGSAPTTVQQHQHHPRYSHPHPPPHPHSQLFPSPAPAHDYHTSFTHHSSLTSTPSQSPQLLAPPSLPHPHPHSSTATATYFLPPTSLSSTSDAQLASFMRAAAGGGMHGAMALNAWSQSVFMSAVAERLGSAGGEREREGVVQGERVGVVGGGGGRSPWKEVGGGGEFVGVGGGVGEKEALGMGMGVGVEQLGGAGESSAMAMDETTWATGWSEVGSSAMGAGMGMGLELMEQSSAGWSAFA